MATILSLQGCMAVGKTTAVKYICDHAPHINISYEVNTDVVEEIKRRNLNKNELHDYIEIQKLWIRKEIQRWHKAQQHPCSVMDFGAEEIEFYTLHYPQSIGAAWDMENLMAKELAELRACLPHRILFLRANVNTLQYRKENDTMRKRSFFDHHITHLLPLKTQWFINKENVDVLDVDGKSKDEAGRLVLEWIEATMKDNRMDETY